MSAETQRRESGRSGPIVALTRWMENLSDTAYAYLLLLPVFFLLGTIAIYPLLRTFEMSLFAQTFTGLGDFVGLDNYINLFTGGMERYLPGEPTFLPKAFSVSGLLTSALTVTVIFALISVFFETLIGLGQALILDQDFYGRRWMRAAIIIPWAVPIVIQGMIFYLMFHPSVGFLTPPLADLGLLAPTNTLNDTASATFVVIVADIWKTSAFMALLILAGLQSINRDLYNVAKVAGASKWQQFKYITFPLILPTVGVAVLFRAVGALRIYGLIDIVSSCTVVPSLSCMVVTSFFNGFNAAAATIAFTTAAIIGTIVMALIIWQGEDAI
ncbi:carbohydrate ABC transporter permease [Halomicrobium urmianum]|uniref:carbohydrate ABC transporter permease n=1 Tax=Halomicrobium urmianum TaxID=1586233 RepID=UPI001CDA362D|nr:sugar ABC transporter permease [Halomicrobium urmianum]